MQALQTENMNVSGGQVEEDKKDLLVRATGEFEDVDEIRNLVLTSSTGRYIEKRGEAHEK